MVAESPGVSTTLDATEEYLTKLPQSLHELHDFFNRWARTIEKIKGNDERIAFISARMPDLLPEQRLLKNILGGIVRGKRYPDIRQATLFANEFILYINNQRLFSARLYIFEPGQYTFVHDHNSWGVYGCMAERIEVVRYRRQDDGSRPGYARLEETTRMILQPGGMSTVHPLNDGIHQLGNPTMGTCVIFSVYGTPIRRLYVNEYDPARNSVRRLYHPRLAKRRLVSRALEAMAVS